MAVVPNEQRHYCQLASQLEVKLSLVIYQCFLTALTRPQVGTYVCIECIVLFR